jgi:hypothetical protein
MIWLGTPAYVGEKLLLGADVSEPEVAVSVYCAPTTPAKVQFESVTIPAEAVNPVQPDSAPPEDFNVIDAVDDVTMLPAESSTFTTGWVVKAVPDTPATGWVVNTNWLAGPGPVGEKLLLGTEVNEPSDAVTVY